MNKKDLVIYISLIVAMSFWSLSFVWYKIAYISFGPISTIFLRLILAAVFLFIMAFVLKRYKPIKKKDLKLFILLAFFEPFLYFLGESYGIEHVSSTLAAVIISTIPLFTLFVAYYYFSEKLTFINIVGIGVSFIGVVMVIFYKGIGSDISLKGILLMFVAVFAAIGYNIFVKKLVKDYKPIMIVGYQNMIGILFFAPLFFILEFKSIDISLISSKAIIAVIELAVFASSFAFILFTYAVREIGIAKANVFANVIPALTAVFAFFMINESFNVVKSIGIGLVITGLLLSQLKRKNSSKLVLNDG